MPILGGGDRYAELVGDIFITQLLIVSGVDRASFFAKGEQRRVKVNALDGDIGEARV
jgi:hypothetical protein